MSAPPVVALGNLPHAHRHSHKPAEQGKPSPPVDDVVFALSAILLVLGIVLTASVWIGVDHTVALFIAVTAGVALGAGGAGVYCRLRS